MSNIKGALRIKQVLELVPFSRSHLYWLVKAGQFPAPFKLGERASAWDAAAVEHWLTARKAASSSLNKKF